MRSLGNKSQRLAELKDGGFRVPAFLTFSSSDSFPAVAAAVIDTFPKDALLAVRSSTANEDGTNQSFAGAFHSEVNVSVVRLEDAWNKVCQSMPSDTANGVVIQEMIFGAFSGVCFADPKNERVMINALPGLCKAVVEGYQSDCYECKAGAIVTSHESDTKTILQPAHEGVTEVESSEKMSENNVEELARLAIKIAQHFEAVQDIEWTIKDNEIFVLQTRPVTANPWSEEPVRIYDSANVGESYSGMVLPLTLTFARTLYGRVYEDLLRHSAVSESTLKNNKDVFDNLVDTVYGRMYYRMDYWYTFLKMLPGSKRNTANLEQMLLLNSRDSEKRKTVRPSLRLRLVYYPLVVWKLLWFGRNMRKLEHEVQEIFNRAREWDLSNWNADKVNAEVNGLFEGVLRRWYLTVENDTVMMSLFAHFSKPEQTEKLPAALQFHSVSTDQVHTLQRLSKAVYEEASLRRAVEQSDEAEFHRSLPNHVKVHDLYQEYLLLYGARFANELKLETRSVEDSFEQFAGLIRLYWKQEAVSLESHTSEKNPWLIRVFHRFASRREVFRLYRARMFGLIRKLVLRKAEILVEQGVIHYRDDVFYLQWEELFGQKTGQDLHQKIESRKQEYKHFEQISPPAFFTVVNGRWPAMKTTKNAANTWQGVAASTGKVTGTATVMKQFSPDSDRHVEVLVTERTDPGWTPLMALSKGLVVEHGGLLSHASIVARELKIPAVIGIENACDQIKNGEQILVDGDTGIVSRTSETKTL